MRIEFTDPKAIQDSTDNVFISWKASIGKRKKELIDFCNDPKIFRGAGATALKTYLTEVHVSVLSAWEDCLTLFNSVLEEYINELPTIDGSPKALIDTEYLPGFINRVIVMKEIIGEHDNRTFTFCSNYREFLKSPTPSIKTVIDSLASAQLTANDQAMGMTNLDSRYSSAYSEVENLLDAIETTSSTRFLTDSDNNYKAGYLEKCGLLSKLTLSDAAIDLIYMRFLNPDGSIDFSVFQKMLEEGDGNLSNSEMRALVRLFSNKNLTYDDIYDICFYGDRYLPGEEDVLLSLGMDLSDIAMQDAEDLLWKGSYTDADLAQLNDKLRRAQELTFLSAIGGIHGFDPGILSGIDLSGLDRINNGEIIYGGVTYPMSNVDELLGLIDRGYEENSEKMTYNNKTAAARPDNYIFGLLTEALSGVPYVGSVLDGFDIARNMIGLLSISGQISDANRELAMSSLDSETRDIGGTTAYVNTPIGYYSIGSTLATDKAMINIAGLERDKGLSFNEALAILMDENNPRNEEIKQYVGPRNDEKNSYENELKKYYHDNYESLMEQYGTKYPDLKSDTPVDNLPLEVLQSVIDLDGSQH